MSSKTMLIKRHNYATYQSTRQPARNQGGSGGEAPLENFSPPLEKCIEHNLKILVMVQKV